MSTLDPLCGEVEALFEAAQAIGARSISLTAPHNEAGVSVLSLALASRFAVAKQHTLLVDLSLDNPCQHTLCDLTHPVWSLDKDVAPEIVQHTQLEGLDLLVAPENKSFNRLRRQGKSLSECFHFWSASYDVVIIDSAPVSHSTPMSLPGEIAAKLADTTLLVVMALSTGLPEVQSAVDTLRGSKVNIGGVVMNDYRNQSLAAQVLGVADQLDSALPVISKGLRALARNSRLINMKV